MPAKFNLARSGVCVQCLCPYQPKCSSQRGGWVLLVNCKSRNLSSLLFLLYNFYDFTRESKWILIDWLRPSRFPPVCFVLFFFFNKTPLHERSLLFFTNIELYFTEKQIHEMYMIQSFLYVLLCWVCRVIKSERSGESPSPSTRKLCKTCIFKNESYRKKRGLGKLIRKIVLGNVLPNIFFFCLGLAKIVF